MKSSVKCAGMADRDIECDCSNCFCRTPPPSVPYLHIQNSRRGRDYRDNIMKFLKCCGVIGAFSVVMYLLKKMDHSDNIVPTQFIWQPAKSCFFAFVANILDTLDSILRYVGKINECARFGIKRNYCPRLSDEIIEAIERPDDSFKVSTQVYLPSRDSQIQTSNITDTSSADSSSSVN